MNLLKQNIDAVLEQIESACRKSGRKNSDVQLITVTKTIPAEVIMEAASFGLTEFGENKVQELTGKLEILKDKFNFHLIGHLQTNKVKYVVGKVKSIQSIDSLKLAAEVNEKAGQLGIICNCMIEINTSREGTKFGMEGKELSAFIEQTEKLNNIKFNGLMTIGTFTDDEKEIRRCFTELRNLKEKFSSVKRTNFEMTELSMGMTSDFPVAIEEGSTIVRIGTAIFGKRIYNK